MSLFHGKCNKGLKDQKHNTKRIKVEKTQLIGLNLRIDLFGINEKYIYSDQSVQWSFYQNFTELEIDDNNI